MKKTTAFLMCIISIGCHKSGTNQAERYLRVHEALCKDRQFSLFAGYQVIPREDHYYIVILDKPRVTLFPTYKGQNEVDIGSNYAELLCDSLKKYYPSGFAEEKVRIIERIGTLISIMKENSIKSVTGWTPYPVDSTGYSIDFWLSNDESLRYESQGIRAKYRKETLVTKIDSSWVDLRDGIAQ